MKKIIQYLKAFYHEHFSWGELAVALVCLVGFCFFRYYNYIPSPYGKLSLLTSWWHKAYFGEYRYIFHVVLYGTPLLFGYLMSSVFHKSWSFWKSRKFWLLSLFAILLFSARSVVHFELPTLIPAIQKTAHPDWLKSMLGTIIRGGIVFVGIWMYWRFTDRKDQPFYGFTLKGFDTKPYFVMLLIMLPLIIAASAQADFLTSYPRVQKFDSLDIANSAHWKHFALYEFLYGLDFFSIEFFFRGFLILAFVGIVGPKAILPMAYIYFVIHWNKPMGELISSFFGGSLLGIIAFYSRSIVGGIIVHVGIAWMMEIGAFISKYFFP